MIAFIRNQLEHNYDQLTPEQVQQHHHTLVHGRLTRHDIQMPHQPEDPMLIDEPNELLHACSTRISPENKYTEVYMNDDYYNLDTCTGTCGECWDILIDENTDKFVLMRKKKNENTYKPLKYVLVLDDGSMDITEYKASEVIKGLHTQLRNEYAEGYI